MVHSFGSTSHGVTAVKHLLNEHNSKTADYSSPVARKCFASGSEVNPRNLREAFERISLVPGSFDFPDVRRGIQSVPASCFTSPLPSRSGSPSPSIEGTPSVSRQQSFTFTPPSWHDASFVSWKPTQAVPRLERTKSTPRLPQGDILAEGEHGEVDKSLGLKTASPATQYHDAASQKPLMPLCREACISGWAEIENAKEMTITSGKKIYRCTYCNGLLKREKNFITTWPKVLFCMQCKVLPQCNSCYKKAVPFLYTDAHGRRNRMEPMVNFGGLNICGQCALINPIADRSAVVDLVRRGREFLQTHFSVKFTEHILFPHTQPEVLSCLQALRTVKDSTGACTIRIDPTAPNRKPIVLRKNDRGEVIELPFEIGPVWHMQLSRQGGQGVYGRCETRSLTFPTRPQSDKGQASPAARTYHVVQRIMLSRGVPESLFYGHLVHELLHAFIWLFFDGTPKRIDPAAEEGLCNCILAAALQHRVQILQARRKAVLDALSRRGMQPKTAPGVKEIQGISQAAEFLKAIIALGTKEGTFANLGDCDTVNAGAKPSDAYLEYQVYLTEYELKVLNRRLSEMEKDLDPAYGVGYRTIRDLASTLSIIKLIEILGQHGQIHESVLNASPAN